MLVSAVVLAAVFAGAVSSASAPVIGTSPTWSPDGTEVAFASSSVDGSTYRLVAASTSGGGTLRTVASGKVADGCCDPVLWSPTGRILFDSGLSLSSVPSSGGKSTRLATNVSWFILSPNGETAAFDGPQGHSPSGIGLVNVRGGKPVLVPRPANSGDSIDGFSPDGTELVFTRGLYSANGALQSVMKIVEHVGGGAPVPLSKSGLIGASYLPSGAAHEQWSPDGRWIAFALLRKLEVVSTGGGAPRILAADIGPDGFSWSPTSKELACVCGPSREQLRFSTVTLQGKRTVLWTNRSLHFVSVNSQDRPQWSPDGSKLGFTARVGPGYPPIQVWVVGADGHGLIRIA